MGAFVVEYDALRWGVVAAFVVAAVIVATRVLAAGSECVDDAGGVTVSGVVDRESDAAHLLMCLVMLAMLVFPTGAAPAAVQGVLTAMVVVYAGLLAGRILQRRVGSAPGAQVAPLVYHVIAAAAMLWAMSGHQHGSQHAAPPIPMLLLAALFTLDAVLMLTPGAKTRLRPALPHSPARTAVIPHIIMDLGTAYMLVAAVAG
ncbi:DUF5134 domain-containing protein [Nocardia wallacei]|uniref:DUF5134 domain-containing protein n=1 Tax=Nocardia wallacei TaxID=480035 RepID=UPI002455F29A|nr:DUF5134 domain-containing protein [Nocardia wallacei]